MTEVRVSCKNCKCDGGTQFDMKIIEGQTTIMACPHVLYEEKVHKTVWEQK